ncbi:MAG TPA: tyrosine-type recombinase/integrase [Solirubrobacteraceae bacterium]|jgi:integrase|nr:tyrosine-type recombinase/integrase [Solirubrobacteraceae bacterium]
MSIDQPTCLRTTSARRSYGTGQLYTRTSAAGIESWYGKWRVDGRRVNRLLGARRGPRTPDGMTSKQAEVALRDAMAALTATEIERLAQDKLRGGKTISEVLDAYLLVRDLKESTATDYAMHVRVHLDPFFGDKAVRDIAAADVERLIAHLTGLGLKVKTVRTYITTLSTLITYAVRKGWARTSPMPAVDLPPLRDHEAIEPLRFLRVHEVNDLVEAVPDGPYHQVDRALYLTAAMTGLRQGELRGLRWEAVDWTAQRVLVQRNIVRGKETSPKSRKARSVPLAPQVAGELEALRRETAWNRTTDPVFADPQTGAPVARTPMMQRYRKALAGAGLDVAFRMHDLRHTMGTSLAMAGIDVVTIQAYLGHSDLATTRRYMHYAPAADEAARIGAAFAIGDPRVPNGTSGPNPVWAIVKNSGQPQSTSP